MNIKTRKLVRMTAATSMLLALGLTGTAQAEHVYCDTFVGLHDALGYLEFKAEKDFNALGRKLDEAEGKDSAGKSCDAAQKLKEFRSKMDSLMNARKPKVKEVHDGTLMCLELGTRAFIEGWDPAWEYLDPDDSGDCEPKQGGKGNGRSK